MANCGMLVVLACLAALCVAEAQSVTMVRPRARCPCATLAALSSAALCCRRSSTLTL